MFKTTFNPYVVLFPFTPVFLLELTVNTRREKENFGGHLEFKSLITWLRVDQSDIFRQWTDVSSLLGLISVA